MDLLPLGLGTVLVRRYNGSALPGAPVQPEPPPPWWRRVAAAIRRRR